LQKKILVIDDEQPTLNMFQLLLATYGYEILTASNGSEGLEIFKRERPDMVLTDIKMPVMNGIEVLKRIKEIAPHTEVIVITGHGDMDQAILALNLDATDFINKPLQRSALSQALKRAEERIAIARSKAEAISVLDVENAVIVTIRGSLTARSEPFLEQAMQTALALGRTRVILHFDENASANGAGLAILTQVLLAAKEKGQRVCLSGLSENFRKVTEVIGISKIVDIFDTDAAALAAP
jgi:anti-anti-sigma factor